MRKRDTWDVWLLKLFDSKPYVIDNREKEDVSEFTVLFKVKY